MENWSQEDLDPQEKLGMIFIEKKKCIQRPAAEPRCLFLEPQRQWILIMFFLKIMFYVFYYDLFGETGYRWHNSWLIFILWWLTNVWYRVIYLEFLEH